jgi:hypothetical protein
MPAACAECIAAPKVADNRVILPCALHSFRRCGRVRRAAEDLASLRRT